jgi:hypothetical protein
MITEAAINTTGETVGHVLTVVAGNAAAFQVPVGGGAENGWVDTTEAWAYASAITVVVSGDLTGKYDKGDKVRLKQSGGTWKYFYITNVVYGAPNTTLTLGAGINYTVANEVITEPYYSKVCTPVGFPQWFNWTPTWTCSGSMTFTGVSLEVARFVVQGKVVTFWLSAYGTIGGTVSTTVMATLPIDSVGAAGTQGCMVKPSSSNEIVGLCRVGGTSIEFYLSGVGNWTAGASRYVRSCYTYAMA